MADKKDLLGMFKVVAARIDKRQFDHVTTESVITELGVEYYSFDEVRQELRGERSGVHYVVGSRVRVQVSRVDLDGRKIDFRMVREGEDAATLPRSRRPAADSATNEVVALKEADRAVKAAGKTKARARSAATLRSGRAGKAAPRKTAGVRGPARGTTRR